MEKIASFSIDHTVLEPGIYISRQDEKNGCTVTTYDLRVTRPNREPVMDMPAVHTAEHLGATYLRNSPAKDEIVYFGPMGCRTGFYLVMFGKRTPCEIAPMIREMCAFIDRYTGEIPGRKPSECGNWLEHNPDMCRYYMRRYLKDLEEHPCYEYPQQQ